MRPGVFADGIQKLNLLQPEFVITIGDVIEGYEKSAQEINEQWDMMLPIINRLEMPFFFIPGNHDFRSKAAKDIWKERLGRNYYHFIYQDVLFLCLNGAGPIGDDQIEYFDNVLKKNAVRWTLVFLHKPRWSRRERADWKKFELLLGNRNYTVFAGHNHVYNKEVHNEKIYYTLATTGGKSGLRGPDRGEFDHFMWVTMNDDGPRIANLLLAGILNDDPRKQRNKAVDATRTL